MVMYCLLLYLPFSLSSILYVLFLPREEESLPIVLIWLDDKCYSEWINLITILRLSPDLPSPLQECLGLGYSFFVFPRIHKYRRERETFSNFTTYLNYFSQDLNQLAAHPNVTLPNSPISIYPGERLPNSHPSW